MEQSKIIDTLETYQCSTLRSSRCMRGASHPRCARTQGDGDRGGQAWSHGAGSLPVQGDGGALAQCQSTSWSRTFPVISRWMASPWRTSSLPSTSKSTFYKARSMTSRTKSLNMRRGLKVWVWLLVTGPVRLTPLLMMVGHCHGNLRTRSLLHHHRHLLHHQKRTEYRVWALPLSFSKLGGGALVSYHPTIFLLLLILVRSFALDEYNFSLILSYLRVCLVIYPCNRVQVI